MMNTAFRSPFKLAEVLVLNYLFLQQPILGEKKKVKMKEREKHDRRVRQDAGVGDGVGEVKQDAGAREVKTCHRGAAPSSKVRYI